MTLGLVSASQGAPSGIAVLFPPVYEIFWSAVAGLIIWLVLGWALPKIYGMIDKRRDMIAEGLDQAERSKEDVALARRQRDEILSKAAEDAKGIRDRATEDAQRTVVKAQSDAHEQAQRISDAASLRIEAERRSAEVSLRNDVGSLASELASRIIGEQLSDPTVSKRVIDKFMDDLENDLKMEGTNAK